MAQFATGHKGALVLEHAYHGITDAVAALTPGAGQPRDPKVVTLASPPPAWRANDVLGSAELAAAAPRCRSGGANPCRLAASRRLLFISTPR